MRMEILIIQVIMTSKNIKTVMAKISIIISIIIIIFMSLLSAALLVLLLSEKK